MTEAFLIFIGAGLGGILRFWISKFSYLTLGHQFPYGTLIVNVSGCFLMGFLYVLLFEKMASAPQLRSLLLVGLLGGYTTFSAFTIETLNLFENEAPVSAMINILLSVILSLLATWLGMLGGRQL